MTLPDAEALLIEALKTVTLPALGGRVGTRLGQTFPAVRVTLLGGPSRPTDHTGLPDLQIEVWGAGPSPINEVEASNIALAIEDAVPDLAGVYSAGTIVAAVISSYLIHSPDTGSGRERYLFTVGLITQ